MFKKTLLAASLALAAAGAQAGVAVSIDFDGAGAGAAVSVGSLDWRPDNVLVTPITGTSVNAAKVDDLVQTYAQGILGLANDVNDQQVWGSFGAAYQFTFVAAFRETIHSVSGSLNDPGIGGIQLRTVSGGTNYFRIYADSNSNANPLTGDNYTDGGKLILEGVINPFNGTDLTGLTDIASTNTTQLDTTLLDKAGVDNYGGMQTVKLQGRADVTATVVSFDSSFFTDLTAGELITLSMNTAVGTPFENVNPSKYVAGQLAADTLVIGNINGVDGSSILLQSDGASTFNKVPEPASAALVGLALAGLGMSRRRAAK